MALKNTFIGSASGRASHYGSASNHKGRSSSGCPAIRSPQQPVSTVMSLLSCEQWPERNPCPPKGCCCPNQPVTVPQQQLLSRSNFVPPRAGFCRQLLKGHGIQEILFLSLAPTASFNYHQIKKIFPWGLRPFSFRGKRRRCLAFPKELALSAPT